MVELNLTSVQDKLKNRLVYGYDIEDYIVRNYSTDTAKIGDLYLKVVKKVQEHLIGQTNKETIELFEIVAEEDFNNRFAEIIDWLTMMVLRIVPANHTEAYVSQVIRDDKQWIAQLEVI